MNKSYLFVIASGIISGSIVFGGKVFSDAGFSLYQISTLPYIFCLALLTGYAFWRRIILPRNFLPLMLLYGFIEAGIIFTQFAAPILGASIAITVLLLYIQPLWTTIISKIILKEKITVYNIIACVLVVVGVLLLINPFDLKNTTMAGFIAALLGGIFLSGWVSTGSHLSKMGVQPVVTMYYGNLIALTIFIISFPFARLFISDKSLVGYDFRQTLIAWLAIIAFGIVTFLINHYCYLRGTQKVRTMDAGVIMLIEPIVGAMLAALFLRQPITSGIIFGGALILLANYLVIRSSSKLEVVK